MSSAAHETSAAPKKNFLIEAAPFGRLDQMLRTEWRRRNKHLIAAAPFGCLDQMLSTVVWGRGLGGLCPPSQKSGGLGGSAPQTPRFLAGGAKRPQTPPLKRSFVTFDRGGQTGPPRSNAFFFGATDDTRAARTSGRTPGRTPGRKLRKKKRQKLSRSVIT